MYFNGSLLTVLTLADNVKVLKYFRLLKKLISCKMTSQFTTVSQNLKKKKKKKKSKSAQYDLSYVMRKSVLVICEQQRR